MIRGAPVLFTVLAFAGCNGGTVDKHALKKDSENIGSFAAEGELLAHDIAKGATLRPYVEVHAGELSHRMSNLADALAERPTVKGIEHKVRLASALAATVSNHFAQLHRHPTDRALARTLERAFRADGDEADKLKR